MKNQIGTHISSPILTSQHMFKGSIDPFFYGKKITLRVALSIWLWRKIYMLFFLKIIQHMFLMFELQKKHLEMIDYITCNCKIWLKIEALSSNMSSIRLEWYWCVNLYLRYHKRAAGHFTMFFKILDNKRHSQNS